MDDTCNHDMGADVKQMCISKVPIFNHLEPAEMREIMSKSRQMIFKKGEIIYHQGDPLEYLYIVHRGRVKIYHLFESGKEQLLRDRKSTRLNSSHVAISYAVFCLKKKKNQ